MSNTTTTAAVASTTAAIIAAAVGKEIGTPKGVPLYQFHLPTKPYTVIDAVNRCYAATGSVRLAMAASHAGFNGHHHGLDWNTYRGYYVGEYQWGERCVWFRGSDFAQALSAALRVYDADGLGACLTISVHTEEAKALCEANPRILRGREDLSKSGWWTWAHSFAGQHVHTEKMFGGLPVDLLTSSSSYEEYRTKFSALLDERRKGGEKIVVRDLVKLDD